MNGKNVHILHFVVDVDMFLLVYASLPIYIGLGIQKLR
jgi:hypothetical protein